MNKRIKGLVKTFLKIAISFTALFLVFRKIEFSTVSSTLAGSDPGLLLLALLGFVLSKTIAAFRLNRFFRKIDVFLTEVSNLKLYLLGMFYNLFLPGGIGGDGYKIYILNKKTSVKTGKLFSAVLIDRINGVFALFCLAVILGFFLQFDINFNYRIFLWLAIPLGSLVFYLAVRKFSNYFLKILPSTTIMSFMVQGLQLVSALLIFLALGGSDRVTEYLFIFLVSSIIAMFPVSIGGVGLRELTFLYGARFLALDEGISVALSLVFYLITAFTSFWGIYYSIRTEKLI